MAGDEETSAAAAESAPATATAEPAGAKPEADAKPTSTEDAPKEGETKEGAPVEKKKKKKKDKSADAAAAAAATPAAAAAAAAAYYGAYGAYPYGAYPGYGMPYGYPASAAPAVPPQAPPSGELPTGWAASWDATYQTYYYYKQSTGERQWERPTGPIIPKGPDGRLRYTVKSEEQRLAAEKSMNKPLSRCKECFAWGAGLVWESGICHFCSFSRMRGGDFHAASKPKPIPYVGEAPPDEQPSERAERKRAAQRADEGDEEGDEDEISGPRGTLKKHRMKDILLDLDPSELPVVKGAKGMNAPKPADYTAAGALFQQRPYPAPGAVLKMKKAP
eukprot:tig00000403_g298.t1